MAFDELFRTLLPFKWRGIEFSCHSFDLRTDQDLVEHKYPNKDFAHVEAMGLAPFVFSAKALFRNGEQLGHPRPGTKGAIYPTQYRLFLAACIDKTTGDLQHPEWGTWKVKCKSAHTTWVAEKRDGADVDVVWVTSDDAPASIDPSPVAATVQFALDLDTQIQNYKVDRRRKKVPQDFLSALSSLSKKITDGIRSVQAIGDRIDLIKKRVVGQITAVMYHLTNLVETVNRVRDPQLWPILNSAERLKGSVQELGKGFFAKTRDISTYIVPKPQTLSMVARTLRQQIPDLIVLNPALASIPVLPSGTRVLYYSNAVSTVAKFQPNQVPELSPVAHVVTGK